MVTEAKHSFWRFGGSLDTIYNWLLGIFFVLSCFLHLGHGIHDGRVPEAIGATVGQTFVLAVVLFVIFKIMSRIRKASK